MKEYETPQLSVIVFEIGDILTMSNGTKDDLIEGPWATIDSNGERMC